MRGLAKRTNHPGHQVGDHRHDPGRTLRHAARSRPAGDGQGEPRDAPGGGEKTASQLPAKLTVPMILFFLPVLFIVILGPAVMKVQDMMGSERAPPEQA